MDVRFETFGPMCQKNTPPLGLIMGDDAFMIEASIQTFQKALKQKHPTLKSKRVLIQKIDHWPKLKEALSGRDFFTKAQLIVCTYPQTALTAKSTPIIESILQHIPQDHWVLFVTKKPTAKQKKHPLYLASQKKGFTLTLWPLNPRALTTWIEQNTWGIQLNRTQIQTLLEKTDQQMWAITQTLERLALLKTEAPITDALLEAAVTTEHDPAIYTLINDALLGKAPVVLKRFHALATPTLMPALTAALSKEVHLLHRIAWSAKHEQPLSQALATHCGWPSKRALLERALGRHSLASLSELLKRLIAIDKINKGMGVGHPLSSLQDILIKLATSDKQPTLTQIS